jgi:hypothetical protein
LFGLYTLLVVVYLQLPHSARTRRISFGGANRRGRFPE